MGDETPINKSLTTEKLSETAGFIPKKSKAYELIPDMGIYDLRIKPNDFDISDLNPVNFKNLNIGQRF